MLRGQKMTFARDRRVMLASGLLIFLSSWTCFVNAQSLSSDDPPLIAAITKGDVAAARDLIGSGANLNVADAYGQNAVSAAIRMHQTELALDLLNAGANPNFPGRGPSPLIDAALQCDLRAAKALLDRGLSGTETTDDNHSLLMFAAETCKDGKLVELLLASRADPNKAETRFGSTALMLAARNGNITAVEELLRFGADPTAQDSKGKAVEAYACQQPTDSRHSKVCAAVREATTNHGR